MGLAASRAPLLAGRHHCLDLSVNATGALSRQRVSTHPAAALAACAVAATGCFQRSAEGHTVKSCCAVLCWVAFCAGTPLGLMQDGSSGSMLLWSGDALHEVGLSNEGKDMWRTYLDYQVGTANLGAVLEGYRGHAVCMWACATGGS